MNTVAQRIAVYFALGMVLATVEITVVTWQFWCILALFWVVEFMVRKGTEEQAMAEGITAYLNMNSVDQERIKKIHRDAMKENNEG
jgi:hypothetical protein